MAIDTERTDKHKSEAAKRATRAASLNKNKPAVASREVSSPATPKEASGPKRKN